MTGKADIRAEAARLLGLFADRGAAVVEAEILQPAGALLDLYGEDIRARAYVTQDPLRGEMMLRPDFTLQVAEGHLARPPGPAAYAYAGEVFRRQEEDDSRAREYIQVGYERFDDPDPVAAEAEVFALLREAAAGAELRADTGDTGFLIAAIEGLDTPDRRRAALRRHLWHPARFRALLERFARPAPPAPSEVCDAPHVGLRSPEEIAERLDALAQEAATPPITAAEAARVAAVLAVSGPAPEALTGLRRIAGADPRLGAACDRLEARLEALFARGIAPETLSFEASYGRTSMEYYDGFVFGLSRPGAGLPPVATGGRYDALCRALGGSGGAVGGVIRPQVLLEVRR